MGIGSALFGGGSSPNIKYKPDSLEHDLGQGALRSQLGNRTGAKLKGYKSYKIGNKTIRVPDYDWSDTGKQVTMASATSPYDFGGIDSAISGLKAGPTKITDTYNPTTFSFANNDLIDKSTANQYALGSGDVRREGQGQLEKLRESVGPRRPGLLMKAGQDSNRSVGETLAKLRMGLDTEALGQKLNLGKDQQLAQAGENFNAAGFNRDTNRYNNDTSMNWLNSLAELSGNKIGLQGNITESERNYQDKGLDYIQNLYSTLLQGRRGAGSSKKGGVLGSIGGLASTASKFI